MKPGRSRPDTAACDQDDIAFGIGERRFLEELVDGQVGVQRLGRLGQLAEEVGYSDETAFRRAYSRFYGVGPGAARSTQQINAENA